MPPNEPEQLSDTVRQLLLGPVDSIEKLEVLLTLHGAAGAPLTFAAVVARACLMAEQVDLATEGLMAAGLIERSGPDTWRIRSEAAARVGDLADAWAIRRPAMLRTLTDTALTRIRAAAARRFADAFRLRRKKDDTDDNG